MGKTSNVQKVIRSKPTLEGAAIRRGRVKKPNSGIQFSSKMLTGGAQAPKFTYHPLSAGHKSRGGGDPEPKSQIVLLILLGKVRIHSSSDQKIGSSRKIRFPWECAGNGWRPGRQTETI
jgi:hypothetical protein